MSDSSGKPVQYRESLKATGITGLSQVFQIVLKMVNTKIVAILLGPAGVGTIGLFQSGINLVSIISGMGLGSSAVREIAKAEKQGDQVAISLTISTLRRLIWLTGIAGALFCLFSGEWLSRLSFGSGEYAMSFRILGLMVFFNQLSNGQLALLQGLRKLKEQAIVSVIGAAAGLVFAAPLYWWLGVSGIVPALLILSIVPVSVAYFFSSKVALKKLPFSKEKFLDTAFPMIKLGISTMLSGLVLLFAMWLIRILVQRKFGLDAVGQFQAGWGVTTIYLQMIFQAMGRDYYPRLAGLAAEKEKMGDLVNEQLHIALLLGTPLLLVAILAAPWIIRILYSAGFEGAIQQLQWLAFGTLFKLISWPMGFVLLALRKSAAYLFTETTAASLLLLFSLYFMDLFGIGGIGIAYSLNYLVYSAMVFIFSKRLIEFSLNIESIVLMLISIFFCSLVFYFSAIRNEKVLHLISYFASSLIIFLYPYYLNRKTGMLRYLWARFVK
jgi:O-antigen/teichoic acid export membrane protein